jgi:hypothetical protein
VFRSKAIDDSLVGERERSSLLVYHAALESLNESACFDPSNAALELSSPRWRSDGFLVTRSRCCEAMRDFFETVVLQTSVVCNFLGLSVVDGLCRSFEPESQLLNEFGFFVPISLLSVVVFSRLVSDLVSFVRPADVSDGILGFDLSSCGSEFLRSSDMLDPSFDNERLSLEALSSLLPSGWSCPSVSCR